MDSGILTDFGTSIKHVIIDWLNGFKARIELYGDLLVIIRIPSLRLSGRHTIIILILHREDGFFTLLARQYALEVEHLTVTQINEDQGHRRMLVVLPGPLFYLSEITIY